MSNGREREFGDSPDQQTSDEPGPPPNLSQEARQLLRDQVFTNIEALTGTTVKVDNVGDSGKLLNLTEIATGRTFSFFNSPTNKAFSFSDEPSGQIFKFQRSAAGSALEVNGILGRSFNFESSKDKYSFGLNDPILGRSLQFDSSAAGQFLSFGSKSGRSLNLQRSRLGSGFNFADPFGGRFYNFQTSPTSTFFNFRDNPTARILDFQSSRVSGTTLHVANMPAGTFVDVERTASGGTSLRVEDTQLGAALKISANSVEVHDLQLGASAYLTRPRPGAAYRPYLTLPGLKLEGETEDGQASYQLETSQRQSLLGLRMERNDWRLFLQARKEHALPTVFGLEHLSKELSNPLKNVTLSATAEIRQRTRVELDLGTGPQTPSITVTRQLGDKPGEVFVLKANPNEAGVRAEFGSFSLGAQSNFRLSNTALNIQMMRRILGLETGFHATLEGKKYDIGAQIRWNYPTNGGR